jgi:hypothetical protein
MKKYYSFLPRATTLVFFGVLVAAMVFAQGSVPQQCFGQYPECNFLTGCDGGTWTYGAPEASNFYVCNGKSTVCNSTLGPGMCNIIVDYPGMGENATCSSTGQTVSCASSVGNPIPLNLTCNNLQCDPTQPISTYPTPTPPGTASQNINLTTWSNFPPGS